METITYMPNPLLPPKLYAKVKSSQRPVCRERGRVIDHQIVKKAAGFVVKLYAFGKQVISIFVIGILGIKAFAKKPHHEPPYIKARESLAQKTSKQFAIEKGGEVNPFKTQEVYRASFTNDQFTNDQKEREHTKYKLKPPFKLQFW